MFVVPSSRPFKFSSFRASGHCGFEVVIRRENFLVAPHIVDGPNSHGTIRAAVEPFSVDQYRDRCRVAVLPGHIHMARRAFNGCRSRLMSGRRRLFPCHMLGDMMLGGNYRRTLTVYAEHAERDRPDDRRYLQFQLLLNGRLSRHKTHDGRKRPRAARAWGLSSLWIT